MERECSSGRSSSSNSSSSSSSSSVWEPRVCLSPLKRMQMDYGMSCGWDAGSKNFVLPKAQRRIVFHKLASSNKEKEKEKEKERQKQKASSRHKRLHASDDAHKPIPTEELGLQADGSIVLPGREWMCIDAGHFFNITSLMNDSRSILEVHYEGFPYLVLFKKLGEVLQHMQEALVNCGPLFRLGHLQPLCEAALYEEADAQPARGTKASRSAPKLPRFPC
ncbi:hypothetical protein, conserved [Eimeria tenella]|uniref:Uncharacterized protein n=1 Tax=Eimeria tenella TaxID=5802 RepID=U6L6N7_EIMTE|nr:hypothetical protein, conserved [Eimeria tenella]CDJ44868.1 hypothetical protein, conserved [Eimeria tenella]|eukprot:XP_013235615.1 hypothetical protein, conserved [Eimeria tenella]